VKDLVYLISAEERNGEGLKKIFSAHPEIKYVSLTAVDLGGNDTDEKIPVNHFLQHIDEYLRGGVQTDGSSVVLPGIATLNDGKVDLIADPSVSWVVDYNYEFEDPNTRLPLGTLRIPSFLKHRERLVDSRAVLKAVKESVERRLLELLGENASLAERLGIPAGQVEEVRLYAATELEFWVRTPGVTVETEKLAVSQTLQESYWKRTKGSVRSALEHSLLMLEKYGLAPEMGHKEVGGVKATLSGQGHFADVMEQLEIDWKYAQALQASDNELLARIVIKEVFRRHGLEVTFMAKPIEGVAGSGEHTHVSVMVALKDGSLKNVFAPIDPQQDFLSPLGWGALMGLLKNYEVVGSLVTATNDAFNRLKPGFEAPVCIVASIGHDLTIPSRNRTVLAGLIRDQANPLATRFEVRAPNPHTNTYLALAGFFQAMMDGMTYAARSGKSAVELQKNFCKPAETPDDYLETGRAYRSEEDVFEHYTEEQCCQMFGIPPATVWEAMVNFQQYPQKTAVLTRDDILPENMIAAYRTAMLTRWVMELVNRIIPDNMELVRGCTRLYDETNDLDVQRWRDIQYLRQRLMRDDLHEKSLFCQIREAVEQKDFAAASRLQLEMSRLIRSLREQYQQYRRNLAN
jgi:glutamine synthetase